MSDLTKGNLQEENRRNLLASDGVIPKVKCSAGKGVGLAKSDKEKGDARAAERFEGSPLLDKVQAGVGVAVDTLDWEPLLKRLEPGENGGGESFDVGVGRCRVRVLLNERVRGREGVLDDGVVVHL